jgi:hypothetical protein
MPIDSVGDPFAEISSEASGLCGVSGAAIRIAETGISTRQELVPEAAGACHRAGFFRVWFGNSKKS